MLREEEVVSMCPVCLATAAWIAAAAVSTGGMTALVLKRAPSGKTANDISTIKPADIASTKEDQDG